MKKMQTISSIRKIIISLIALIILIWAFFRNVTWTRIIIIPFLVCSFAMLCENLFLLLNKKKLSNIFKYIFRISFFVYAFGFLAYMVYYAFAYKSYSFLIGVVIFLPFVIYFFKKVCNTYRSSNSKFLLRKNAKNDIPKEIKK